MKPKKKRKSNVRLKRLLEKRLAKAREDIEKTLAEIRAMTEGEQTIYVWPGVTIPKPPEPKRKRRKARVK